jgi:glycosyltransferase involved in cell wall biosynthesis
VADFFEDGRMGYMTESTAPEALAELLGRVAADEPGRREMARYNAAFARERFLSSRVVARLEGIYDRVMAS